MADKELAIATEQASSRAPSSEEAGLHSRPASWKYRPIKFGFIRLPYYASPQWQIVMVALVCFMCPGMFNALNGMGGGGLLDHKAGADANVAVYSTFAVVGFFAGTITNRIGIKAALCFGGIGYSIYVSSYLAYKHASTYGYSVAAGAILGVCAGLLWCAQGAIMMSYPPEKSKGKYISWFWMIFNLGAVVGSLVPLGQNIHVTTRQTVSDGTYIGLLTLTVIGALLALALVPAKDVIRDDGSKIILMKNPTWKSELLGLLETFKTDPYIILLFPMFFASNWFYTYHFNDYNGAIFNTRTAALNNTLYYLMQIVAAYFVGYLLDLKRFRRTTKARALWVTLFVLTMAIWGGGLDVQLDYTREEVNNKTAPVYDWKDSGYIGRMFLYMFYGFYDATWQTSVYWLMGSLTNNGRKLANFAGFYKGIQSAGAAIIWRLDEQGIPYLNVYGSSWGLLGGALLFSLPVIWTKIKDHVPIEDDIKFSDETIEAVEAKTGGKQERLDGSLDIDRSP